MKASELRVGVFYVFRGGNVGELLELPEPPRKITVTMRTGLHRTHWTCAEDVIKPIDRDWWEVRKAAQNAIGMPLPSDWVAYVEERLAKVERGEASE